MACRPLSGQPLGHFLRPEEEALLQRCAALPPDSLYGLLEASPSLGRRGIRRPMLMALVKPLLSPGFRSLTATLGASAGRLTVWPLTRPELLDDRLRARRLSPAPGFDTIPPGTRLAKLGEAEPAGGYFVFRNSWGFEFGRKASDPDRPRGPPRVPLPGYGTISASHVEAACWEAVSFALDEVG